MIIIFLLILKDEKKNIYLIYILLVLIINLASSLAITNVTISNEEGYNVFVNKSGMDSLELNNSDINVYSISSESLMTNINPILDSKINFYNFVIPYNDIKWDNGTIILRDISIDFDFFIPALRGIWLGIFDSTTNVTISTGGSPSLSFIKSLNPEICEYSYKHILKNGDNNIEKLKSDLDSMNILIDYNILKSEYIDSFQGGCSEVIERTLKPEFVCLSIENYIENTNTTIEYSDIDILREQISLTIPITHNLLRYYINNFNEVCEEYYKSPLEIKVKDLKVIYILIFIILILGIIILSTGKRYKKIIKMLKKI